MLQSIGSLLATSIPAMRVPASQMDFMKHAELQTYISPSGPSVWCTRSESAEKVSKRLKSFPMYCACNQSHDKTQATKREEPASKFELTRRVWLVAAGMKTGSSRTWSLRRFSETASVILWCMLPQDAAHSLDCSASCASDPAKLSCRRRIVAKHGRLMPC